MGAAELMRSLDTFYQSNEWVNLMRIIRQERLDAEGQIICAYCGKPIVKKYDCIGHHRVHLTEENVNDVTISLNPDNVALVHARCHNKIHEKLGYSRKEIFLVYGPPMAGKSSYVKSTALAGDLIIDMDSIWECISGQPRYVKPGKLKAVAFGVRDYLMDCLRVRNGKWQSAYIIGGFPLISERERMVKQYGAREVFIDTDEAECIRRLREDPQGRNVEEWTEYIEEWFRRFNGSNL